MKKKILIVIVVIWFLIGFVYFRFKKNDIEDNINNVEDIDISVSDDIIESVDFDSLKKYNIELTETLKITNGGVYTLSGNISDGQIYVDTKDSVKLILDNVNITNETGSTIMIENANVVYIELKENSVNYLTDSANYNVDSEDEPNGTVFSKDDLVFTGTGKLIVNANYEDGIVSKDNLKIESGNYLINSKDDAIRGKDSIVIEDGNFSINALGDGIKATNDTDETLGYILIKNGDFKITSTNDGIQAETNLLINNGTFDIKTGGGSDNSSTTNSSWGMWGNTSNSTDTESAKALKATKNIVIDNGFFNIDSSDDAIHSNEHVGIIDGEFVINSGDDGIHADSEVIIDGGKIRIEQSYEGIEAENITINGGDISVVASDDGMNAAGGNDASAMGGRPGQNNFANTGNAKITINNGNIFVNSKGDGLDANGAIYVNGGIIVVNGPTDSGNGALDYDSEFKITGGTFVASGSSGMSQSASNSSTQNTIMINFTTTIGAGNVISIKNSDENEIITYEASKNYQNIVISSSDLKQGETYSIYINGTSSNEKINGLYNNGGYSGGSSYSNITISGVNTSLGNSMGMNQGMQGPMGGMQRR